MPFFRNSLLKHKNCAYLKKKGGDFSVGHIELDFDLKLLLCWTNAFGHTLLGSFVYVVICWAVEDTLCWAVGHWASVALCWAVIIICTLLGNCYCMESVGHVQQSYWQVPLCWAVLH